MLRLIQVEFMKIKRQKFIILTLLASLLVPFPWCIVCIRDNLGFQDLFRVCWFTEVCCFCHACFVLRRPLCFTERKIMTPSKIF